LLFKFGDEVERSVREVNALLGELPEEAGKPRKMFVSESSEDHKVKIRPYLIGHLLIKPPDNEYGLSITGKNGQITRP
jgi:hypothetical protein